ncbi:MAG: 3-dehydroquinate synthase family protein [Spirochaetaceae bacterium]
MNRTYEIGGYTTTVTVETDGPRRTADALERRTDTLCIYDETTAGIFAPSGSRGVVLPAGESSKRWESVARTLEEALSRELDRGATFVGVGGGVVTDVAAFAASVYLRGVRVELVPTTLLAMVDAAFGGKTGINFGGYKNMVGTFHPAAHLHVHTACLESLSEREFKSGLAEAIKSALLGDVELYEFFSRERERVLAREPEALRYVVDRSLGVKAAVVEQDLREQGRRAILNLGHTFAHAVEAVVGLGRFSHGEAVAWGIGRALEVGRRAGMTDEGYARHVTELLRSYGFEMGPLDVDRDQILGAMRYDKKRTAGRLNLVLQEAPGRTMVRAVPESAVRDVL